MNIFFLRLFICSMIGITLCQELQSIPLISPVAASAIVGLLASLIPKKILSPESQTREMLYAASFIAMSSKSILNSLGQTLVLSLILTLVFIASSKNFKGFGGKLGTLAFISVCLFSIGELL